MHISRAATLSALVLLSGCATSGYSEFYRPTESLEQVAASRAGPAPEEPELITADDAVEAAAALARKGYISIGYASFSSGADPDEGDAIDQGIAVGADIVVMQRPRFLSSRTSSIPVTVPTSTTSQTTSSGTIYGSGGTATVQGNATTTTTGSQTNYIPFTVNRFEYGAIFLVKRKLAFGAVFRDLTDEERRQTGSNRGVVITTVVDGGAAYTADLLPEDMVVDVGGLPVAGVEGMRALIQINMGKQVEMGLLRKGVEKIIRKPVLLPPQ